MKSKRTKINYCILLVFCLEIIFTSFSQAQTVKKPEDSLTGKRPAADTETGNSKKDSPVLRTQIKEGIHNLGSDIHDAWGILKGDVTKAGNAGKTYINKQRSKDSLGSATETGLEKRKEIVKVYAVSAKDKLYITNKHGEVSVSTWDKNEIRVEISIRVKGGPDKLLQESLNQVSIKENRHDDRISLETEIAARNENAFQSLLKNRPDIDYQVNYKVFMPGQNHIYPNATTGSDI